MVKPNFPIRVWDGLSARTERTSLSVDQWPNHQDWNQIVAEVRSIETTLLEADVILFATIAAEDIYKGDVITIRSDEKAEKANSDNGIVSGVAKNDTPVGGFLLFATSGSILLNTWSLSPGSLYFLNGSNLSLNPPGTGWIVQLGRAISSTIFDLNIQQPIKL